MERPRSIPETPLVGQRAKHNRRFSRQISRSANHATHGDYCEGGVKYHYRKHQKLGLKLCRRSIVNDPGRRDSRLTETGTLVDDDSDEECSCDTMFMQKQRSQAYQSSRTMWHPRPSFTSTSLAPVPSAESSSRNQRKTSQMSRQISQDSLDSNSSNYATASDQGNALTVYCI